MAKEEFFKYINPAPLSQRLATRDGCIYMYRLMKFIGWIPPKEGQRRYLYFIWTFTTFALGTIYLPVGFVLSFVKELDKFTTDEFLTSLQVSINSCGSSVKCLILYIYLWRLRKTENILDELDKRIVKDRERQKVHETVALSNYIFLIFTIIYNGYIGYMCLSYVASGRAPYSVYNPFLDWRDSQINLYIQATFEYIITSIAVTQNQLSDTYLLVFMILIRGHFNLTMDRVRDLRTDPSKTEEENYEDMVNCIKDHKMILQCCNMIRPIISGTIFVQFGLIGSVLGLSLINIFFFSNLWRGLASILFVIAVLMETFPFCYNCNLLIDDCEEFGIRMFQSNWIDASPRYKSTLIHFLHQAQQPIVFIAGGIIPITLNSNIIVAKFAFSIFTIVREMNLAEQFK
ncbi:odorant receptor 59b-like [Drosophila innubila]|uniref:odorant receptor 59b-like n=1 Tax=Drosophila innubila TaxID=198719 RepID=UPI00148D4FDA|nr:odorant receptor 59b-like [Drosophila innubila]